MGCYDSRGTDGGVQQSPRIPTKTIHECLRVGAMHSLVQPNQ